MAELPESPFGEAFSAGVNNNSSSSSALSAVDQEKLLVVKLIRALHFHPSREVALQLLAKKKRFQDLACYLWYSVGTIAVLMLEIISVYPLVESPMFTYQASNRVCNVLALIQSLATHPDTRKQFIKAQIPVYLYPFLDIVLQDRAREFLRLTSLGVIGALVKTDDAEAVYFLLESRFLPHCLHSMETGSELAKTVASFIMKKILVHDEGLRYCCKLAERFYAIGRVLSKTVDYLTVVPSPRLLKNVVSCYVKLSEHPRTSHVFRLYFPRKLLDDTFIGLIREDPTIKNSIQQLMYNLGHGPVPAMESLGNSFV